MAWLFSKHRNDGHLITDGHAMQHIMPYVMRGRNESAVYLSKTIDIGNMRKYIRAQRREGRRITLFNIIVTALLFTIYQRPQLNRFIAGRRMYERKELDVLYVVKREFTDGAEESVCRVTFDTDDNLFSVADKMYRNIAVIKEELEEKSDDKLMNRVRRLPRWMLRSAVGLIRWLDFHGILPASWQDSIPLYSTVYLSHIGSLGAEAPFHHLYEFGTTSIFVTVGKIYELPRKTREGELEWYKAIDLMFTVDERICDGYYLIKSLRILDDLLLHPEKLETPLCEITKPSDQA